MIHFTFNIKPKLKELRRGQYSYAARVLQDWLFSINSFNQEYNTLLRWLRGQYCDREIVGLLLVGQYCL